MSSTESHVHFGWTSVELVWREGLLICLAWLSVPFLPAWLQASGVILAWAITLGAVVSASWKAGFTAIMLVLMGLVAMAFGKLYGVIFFSMAATAIFVTFFGVTHRRSTERKDAFVREVREREDAGARLQRLREESLSAGAAFRRGESVNKAPGGTARGPSRAAPAPSPRVRTNNSGTTSHQVADSGGDLGLLTAVTVVSLVASSSTESHSLPGACSPTAHTDSYSGGYSGGGCASFGD